jgi:hypothetical protein
VRRRGAGQRKVRPARPARAALHLLAQDHQPGRRRRQGARLAGWPAGCCGHTRARQGWSLPHLRPTPRRARRPALQVAPQQQAPLQRKTSGAGANAPGKPPLPTRGPSGNFNKLNTTKSSAGAEAAEAGEAGAKGRSSNGGAEADKDYKLKSAQSQQEQ